MRIINNGTVHQITFMPRLFPVNCYLIEEENDLTLIDAAMPFSFKGIIKAAEGIGKPITRIVLTHAHGDHVGALDALKEALPNVKVYISKRDAKLMEGDTSLLTSEPQTPIKGDVPKKLITRADVLLEDGDRVESLLAIAAPGHTPGSMAFLDTRTNALIAGDAFQTRGGVAVAGQMRPFFPFPALATWNKVKALESARKLQGYHPTILAVGHGEMMYNPNVIIEKAIGEAERNI